MPGRAQAAAAQLPHLMPVAVAVPSPVLAPPASVQAQAAEFQRVLATAGFTVGINAASWEQKFRVWAAQVGLAQGQVEAAVQRQQMIFDLLGKAALAYAVYSGAGTGTVGGGSGPTGGAGGGILPSSVG